MRFLPWRVYKLVTPSEARKHPRVPTYRRLCLPLLWLLPLLWCAGCSHLAQDSWTGRDKAQHFVGSALLAVAGSAIAEHQSASPARSRNIGFGLAITFGALKEAWDSRPNGTGWSWKDFTWDVAGAAAGYSLYALSN